jgi:hypothetical protein
LKIDVATHEVAMFSCFNGLCNGAPAHNSNVVVVQQSKFDSIHQAMAIKQLPGLLVNIVQSMYTAFRLGESGFPLTGKPLTNG